MAMMKMITCYDSGDEERETRCSFPVPLRDVRMWRSAVAIDGEWLSSGTIIRQGPVNTYRRSCYDPRRRNIGLPLRCATCL